MSIIVGVDGSEESEQALRWALEEARARGAGVIAVMVYSVPPSYYPYGVPGAASDSLLETIGRQAETELAELLERTGAEAEGLSVEAEVAEHHQPARALTDRAGRDDLLVVGSRGRGGFTGLLLGSVSQQVVHHAPCPVVVVRGESAEETAEAPPAHA